MIKFLKEGVITQQCNYTKRTAVTILQGKCTGNEGQKQYVSLRDQIKREAEFNKMQSNYHISWKLNDLSW